MPAQKGKDLLLKIADSTGAFITVAGLRTRRLAFNTEAVDITHSESVGRWRELLEGAGVRRCALSGAGIFKDEASDTLLRELFFGGTIRQWQVIIPAFGTLEGAFQVTALDYRGEHQGEVTFDLTVESAGLLTFTPL